MENKGIRPAVGLAVLAALAALVLVLSMFGTKPPPPSPDRDNLASAAGEPADLPSETRSRTSRDPSASPRRSTAAAPTEAPEYIEGLVYGEIDLREARALMPDNLYWKFGVPTKNEKVLAEREDEKIRRNEEYGKVLSGDASEDEVKAYYDYRKQLASDYLEFAEFMSRRYKDSKNEQFVGMLDLAMKLNAQRLAQLPSELEAALQRSRERAVVREDWQRQQQEFGRNGGMPADDEDQ